MKDFSRIIASRPLDSTAANVMRPGHHYEPSSPEGGDAWFTQCPKTYAAPYSAMNTAGWDSLAGRTYGNLRVIGYGGGKGNSKGARWVCRCVCGRYVYRRTQSIKKELIPGEFPNSCPVCTNADRTRNGRKSLLTSSPGRSNVR